MNSLPTPLLCPCHYCGFILFTPLLWLRSNILMSTMTLFWWYNYTIHVNICIRDRLCYVSSWSTFCLKATAIHMKASEIGLLFFFNLSPCIISYLLEFNPRFHLCMLYDVWPQFICVYMHNSASYLVIISAWMEAFWNQLVFVQFSDLSSCMTMLHLLLIQGFICMYMSEQIPTGFRLKFLFTSHTMISSFKTQPVCINM